MYQERLILECNYLVHPKSYTDYIRYLMYRFHLIILHIIYLHSIFFFVINCILLLSRIKVLYKMKAIN